MFETIGEFAYSKGYARIDQTGFAARKASRRAFEESMRDMGDLFDLLRQGPSMLQSVRHWGQTAPLGKELFQIPGNDRGRLVLSASLADTFAMSLKNVASMLE
jgi:hypothetical protein